MLGKIGGLLVDLVAMLRETTAEARILSGGEYIGGTGTNLLDAATSSQAKMAEEILGRRQSADDVGAFIELGWLDVETKGTKARPVLW